MQKYRSVFVILFFLILVTPNIVQVFLGDENFPFSNNPMFGHYITNEDELATLSFLIETDNGIEKMDYDKYGLWEVRLKRFYFSNVYGSSEPNSPQRNTSPTQEAFEKNNTVFFNHLYEIISQETCNIRRIYLAMDRLSKDGDFVSRKNIGIYNPQGQSFKML